METYVLSLSAINITVPICRSVSLYPCLLICVFLSFGLSFCLSLYVCLFDRLFVRVSAFQSVCVCAGQCVCLPVYWYVSLSVCLPSCLYTCLFLCLLACRSICLSYTSEFQVFFFRRLFKIKAFSYSVKRFPLQHFLSRLKPNMKTFRLNKQKEKEKVNIILNVWQDQSHSTGPGTERRLAT